MKLIRNFVAFFGIIRSAGGGKNKPTASSFLQLFRMLSLYYPTKTLLRGCNVDGQENMVMLTSYMDWLVNKFKENRSATKKLKNYMNDVLLQNIMVYFENNAVFDGDLSVKNENVVHQISGYLIYRFLEDVEHCDECHKTMELKAVDIAVDFTVHHFTKTKSKGKLKYSSPKLVQMLKKVEFWFVDFL